MVGLIMNMTYEIYFQQPESMLQTFFCSIFDENSYLINSLDRSSLHA